MGLSNLLKPKSEKAHFGIAVWSILILAALATTVYIIVIGPLLGHDSDSYIEMDIIRPPGYPLFLQLIFLLSGHSLTAVVVVQALLNASVVLFFIWWICRKFRLPQLFSLLLLPLAFFYVVNVVQPEFILTEAVAFPLFILMVICTAESLIQREMKALYIALIINALLVVTRGQFLFMYPVFLLIGSYILYRNSRLRNPKAATLLLLATAGSFGMTVVINKSYHLTVHNTFSGAQSNVSFIRNALYISDHEDYKLFESEELKELHRDLYDTIYTRGLNSDAFYDKIEPQIEPQDRRRSDIVEHYHESLIEIADLLREDLIQERYPGLDWNEYAKKRDELFGQLSKRLIADNFGSYLYFIVAEMFMYGFFGGRPYAIFSVIVFLLSFFGLYKENRLSELLTFFFIAHLLNMFISGASNRVLYRYTFYIEFILITFLLILILKFILLDNIEPERDSNKK